MSKDPNKLIRACAAFFALAAVLMANHAYAHGGGGFGYKPIAPVYHHGKIYRDPEVAREFQRLHPCPSTGLAYGSCPGYVRDHKIPLCMSPYMGGINLDTTENMAWQPLQESLVKDEWEREECKKARLK
jgi:hypothetical protein